VRVTGRAGPADAVTRGTSTGYRPKPLAGVGRGHCDHVSVDIADCGEGVVDGSVLAEIQVDQVDTPLGFGGGDPHLIADFNEFGWAVLTSGCDIDFGAVVVEVEKLTRMRRTKRRAALRVRAAPRVRMPSWRRN
jgi:hypothetical protein